jgi:hypothetical protein
MQPTKVRIDKKVNNMADPSGIYGENPFASMSPQEFLKEALGKGLGKTPISNEFPGLGDDFSDIAGIDSFFEDRAENAYKGIDPSVLANQAEAGNELAAAEIEERSKSLLGEFGGLEPITEIPKIDMSGLDVEYQMEQAEKEKARGEAAEAQKPSFFNAGDAMAAGQAGAEEALNIKISQDNIEKASISAMNDYIQAARGSGPDISEVKDIKDYKEKFAEATGIDISGEVDKSHALMTFGLALMQNKAGKGFNVGKMLTSVGKAGETAMPALQKAREQTRLNGIAAGKYALESKSSDEAKALAAKEKAMQRTDYFVLPKSENMRGLLANLAQGEGKRKSLSKYELDKLMKNPEFSSQFEVLPGSVWSSVVSEAMKSKEAPEYFLTKSPRSVEIMPGDDGFSIEVFDANPNLGKAGTTQAASTKEVDSGYRKLRRLFEKNQKDKEKFISLQTAIEAGSVNVFSAVGDKVEGLASALGIRTKGLNSDAKMRAVLKELQAESAEAILGEIKGTSDFERQLVSEIVGDKTVFTDPKELEYKIANIYEKSVKSEEKKILEGLITLDGHSNNKVSDYFGDGELTEEERKSMNADLKAMGAIK